MSYGLKYTVPFKTISEVGCAVNIEEKGFIGQPVELTAGATPFTIDTDTGDLLTPVRGSGATIQVFGSDYLQDLYTSDPQGVRVTLLVDGVVKWLGYTIELTMKGASTMRARNAQETLNYFDTGKTNALLEGFNSIISLIKHRARGFRNMMNNLLCLWGACSS